VNATTTAKEPRDCHNHGKPAGEVGVTYNLTDISKLPEYRQVKAEFIQGGQPASTALEVSALALPGMLIEVEATAVL
jgi:enamine deaminase RidA (YjgF/YER057c/UK114 family)